MNRKTQFMIFIILISSILISSPAFAAKEDKPPKLFTNNTEMAITLTGPWKTIQRNIKKDALYPAQLTYTTSDGQQSTIDVEVAPRGRRGVDDENLIPCAGATLWQQINTGCCAR